MSLLSDEPKWRLTAPQATIMAVILTAVAAVAWDTVRTANRALEVALKADAQHDQTQTLIRQVLWPEIRTNSMGVAYLRGRLDGSEPLSGDAGENRTPEASAPSGAVQPILRPIEKPT